MQEVHIDDESPTEPDKVGSFFTQLVAYKVLNLAKLEGDESGAVVLGDCGGIVPVGRYVYQPV